MSKEKTQIRSLPRSGEVPKKSIGATAEPTTKGPPRWIVYVGALSVLATISMFLLPSPNRRPVAAVKTESASLDTRPSNIDRYAQDTKMKQQMMMRKSELENQQFRSTVGKNFNAEDFLALPEPEQNLGVQLDSENSAEKVYEDLNDAPVAENNLPSDRINAGLVNRKWVTQLERRQRIQFVSNFIKSAREQGLEVEIDPNLVVVGVRRINETKKLDINQVMDRLARQGF